MRSQIHLLRTLILCNTQLEYLTINVHVFGWINLYGFRKELINIRIFENYNRDFNDYYYYAAAAEAENTVSFQY